MQLQRSGHAPVLRGGLPVRRYLVEGETRVGAALGAQLQGIQSLLTELGQMDE